MEVLEASLDAYLSPESCEDKTQLLRTKVLGRLHGCPVGQLFEEEY